MENAVTVRNLTKVYNDKTVVDGISFDIHKGEIFGFLGPNGAGKTTTMEMIEGLRPPTDGTVSVFGLDVIRDRSAVMRITGVQLQASVLDNRMTVEETIELYASYYCCDVDVDAILEDVQLTEKRSSIQRELSGGQSQRLALALALVNDPDILFLDEPTTGLDPQSRRNLWDIVLKLRERGKTLMLTTHYMDEAEKLCDRIAIIDHGKIIAEGSVQELIENLDARRVITLPLSGDAETLKAAMKHEQTVEIHDHLATIYTSDVSDTLEDLLAARDQVKLDDLHVRMATIEDVFIHLTGRQLRE